jgi:hypothetical protein
MVRAIKSLLRWSFFAAVAVLAPSTIIALVWTLRAVPASAPFSTYVAYFGFLALACLYAAAWWTTRQPRASRNIVAIAACVANIAIVILLLRYSLPVAHLAAACGLFFIVASIAGVFLYARGEAVPDRPPPPTRRSRVPGDRTSPWTDRIAALFFVAATWEITGLWFKWASDRDLLTFSLPASILFIVLATFTTAVVHESGHALVAAARDMRFLGFYVGPFQMRKREGRWKFKLKTSGFFGGGVHAVPTHPDLPASHDLLMIAAGPAANLITCPIFLWATLHSPDASWQPAWLYLAMLTSFSFVVPLYNLFPLRTKAGNYSDGARILQILTHSPVLELHRVLRRLQSALVTPLRFRDLDPEAFQRIAARYPGELAGLHLQLCAVVVYTDADRLDEARAALAAAEAIYNDSAIDLSRSLHLSFVLDHAMLNRDAAAARLWWDRMERKKKGRQNFDFWLARSALLWIEGHLAEAEDAWQQADSRAQKLPHFGAYEYDRSRCALLRQELDKASLPPETAEFRPSSQAQVAM